jgi:hypothetical protein
MTGYQLLLERARLLLLRLELDKYVLIVDNNIAVAALLELLELLELLFLRQRQ